MMQATSKLISARDGSVTVTEYEDGVDPPPPHVPTREEQERNRQAAFQREADPLFFKWQAGEGHEADWLAKREAIRARYPYPE